MEEKKQLMLMLMLMLMPMLAPMLILVLVLGVLPDISMTPYTMDNLVQHSAFYRVTGSMTIVGRAPAPAPAPAPSTGPNPSVAFLGRVSVQ